MTTEPTVDPIYGSVTIRRRARLQSSPPRGMRQEWLEWQVCQGRRILKRLETEEQATRWLRENIADKGALKNVRIIR